MEEEDVEVFEWVATIFLNENLPTNFSVTMVEVRDQRLLKNNIRRILHELQSSPYLQVEMHIEGIGAPSAGIFDDEIDVIFENQENAFENKLADASSFFRRMFNPNPVTRPTVGNGVEGSDGTGFLTAGSFLFGLAIVVIIALFVKYQKLKNREEDLLNDILSHSTVTTGSGVIKEGSDDDGRKVLLLDSVAESDQSGTQSGTEMSLSIDLNSLDLTDVRIQGAENKGDRVTDDSMNSKTCGNIKSTFKEESAKNLWPSASCPC